MKSSANESLEEIWEIRRTIAHEFNADQRKYAEYLREKQKQSGSRIYSGKPATPKRPA
jgi:hypothetical protein